MRQLLNIVIAVTIMAALGGGAWRNHADTLRQQQREFARSELHRLRQQILLQSQMVQDRRSRRQYPATVDPAWFEGALPSNPFLSDEHPWLEIASVSERAMLHPRQRIALNSRFAKFWYNPNNGCIRARVPAALSEHEALELYAQINGTGGK